MRPTRSTCFTIVNFERTVARSVSLPGPNSSLITLKTYGYDGSVKTSITWPRIPGASTNSSLEWCRCCSRSRKKSVFPCLPSPSIV